MLHMEDRLLEAKQLAKVSQLSRDSHDRPTRSTSPGWCYSGHFHESKTRKERNGNEGQSKRKKQGLKGKKKKKGKGASLKK